MGSSTRPARRRTRTPSPPRAAAARERAGPPPAARALRRRRLARGRPRRLVRPLDLEVLLRRGERDGGRLRGRRGRRARPGAAGRRRRRRARPHARRSGRRRGARGRAPATKARWPARTDARAPSARRRPRDGWAPTSRTGGRRRRGIGGAATTAGPAGPDPEPGAAFARRGAAASGGGRARGAPALLQGLETGEHLLVAGGEGQRLLVARDGARDVAEALQALREEPAGQDVVGRALQDLLELDARRRPVAGVEEGAPEGHPRRRVVLVLLQPLAGHADGVLELAVLAQLLRELREQTGARLLVQLLPELFDARVAGHGASERGRSQAPAGPGTGHAVGRLDSTLRARRSQVPAVMQELWPPSSSTTVWVTV